MHFDHAETPRARIVWLAPESGSLDLVRPIFAAAGYEIRESHLHGQIDIAVVDFRSHRVTTKIAERLSSLARRAAPECGVVYLGSPFLSVTERAHLRRAGDLVIIDDDLKPAVQACRQRLRLRNVAEETGERLKSIAACARLTDFPSIETRSAAPTVLVAGAPGAVAIAALQAVSAVAAEVIGVLSASQALRAIETGCFDGAVFLPSSAGDPLIGLARALRRHRRYQDLPIIMAAVQDPTLQARLAAISGADYLPMEHIFEDLGPRISALSRRARLVATMRNFLSACAGDGVRDKRSGAFTPQFFAQHAERLFSRADQVGRPVSLIGIKLEARSSDMANAPVSRTLNQSASIINRITRAEDFVGRLTADTFLISMNGINLNDSRIAARRIEGVIANTMFRTGSKGELFAVATASAAFQRPKSQRLEETIANVLALLNKAAPRTAER